MAGSSPPPGCCRRARRPLGVAAAGALLAALVPKCPLCLAAYLSFLGAATGATATAVSWLPSVGVALAVVALSLVVRRWIADR